MRAPSLQGGRSPESRFPCDGCLGDHDGVTAAHSSGEPPEHLRFARYVTALETVAEDEEAHLVTKVLRDTDTRMATSAVVRHLDRRAAALLTGERFVDWVRVMAGLTSEHPFLQLRLDDWARLRTVVLDQAWAAEELTTASDWLQRSIVNTTAVVPPEALRLLAARGRTRRVRAAARTRLSCVVAHDRGSGTIGAGPSVLE